MGLFDRFSKGYVQVAEALYNDGLILENLGRLDSAIWCYDELIRKFRDSRDWRLQVRDSPRDWHLQVLVAQALFAEGRALVAQGRRGAAIVIYDQLIREFGYATGSTERALVAQALFLEGNAFHSSGDSQKALAAYDSVLKRTGDAADELATDALLAEGGEFLLLDRGDEALAVYNDFLSRFGGATDPAVLKSMAKVLFERGRVLHALRRSDEALAVYNDFLSRFGGATDPAVHPLVTSTRLYKCILLAIEGHSVDGLSGLHDLLADVS